MESLFFNLWMENLRIHLFVYVIYLFMIILALL